MPWSKQQQQAIDHHGSNILVAAAAGSGKTSVLVERIIQKLIKGTCDINEILVVTFTNAAASEMHGRIGKAIAEKLDAAQKDRQLVLLNAASISTLHSFCQNILRQYFYHIDLDPKFRLGNPQEIDLLKYDVLDKVFEEAYDEENADFVEFTSLYGNERGDEAVYELVLRLFEYSRAQPFADKWIETLPEMYDLTPEDLAISPWFKLLKYEIEQDIQAAIQQLEEVYEFAKVSGSLKYEDMLQGDIIAAKDIINAIELSWDKGVEAIKNYKAKRFNKDKEAEVEVTETVQNKRGSANNILKELKGNYLLQSIDEMVEDLPILAKQARGLCDLTLRFSAAFAQHKAEKNIIDFSDLEHLTLQVLATPESTRDNLIPSDIAKELQGKYKEIMVDEYQDTNGVQEAILNLVAGTEPHKFYVGDVKQSIYKFRLAEPELFLDKYLNYPCAEDSIRIDLAQNFRSRPEILAGVNFIFSQIMNPVVSELPYGEDEALRYGLDYPEQENSLKSPIELAIFTKDSGLTVKEEGENSSSFNGEDNEEEAGYQAEIKYIIQRLKTLYASAPQVYDKDINGYRPLKWRDIVILLRSIKGKARDLSEAMREAGIPVYASEDSGYFQEIEVQVMLSLLRTIDNPQQDIPLTAVLFSSIGSFTAEELGEIRRLVPKVNMYRALLGAVDLAKGSLQVKLQQFLARLTAWRDYAHCHSVPELLWRLYEETGYYEYVGGLPEGTVRQANLRALYDRARAYETTSFRGLFRFLRFIDRMQQLGNDLAVARTLGEGEDVVRIMSIHKSKGLEFPVVIMPNLGKRFNMADLNNGVLFHKDLGLGMYLKAEEISYDTLSHEGIRLKLLREYKAEEMRVLYVAMTRAREKLIMTGSLNSQKVLQEKVEGARSSEPTLPLSVLRSANTYLDWIIPALVRHKDGFILRGELEGEPTLQPLIPHDSSWNVQLGGAIPPDEGNIVEVEQDIWRKVKNLEPIPIESTNSWVKERMDWQYGYNREALVPAKLTVTEIKRRFALAELVAKEPSIALELGDTQFKRPEFIQAKQQLTGAEYGTAVHNVLQYVDLTGDLSAKGIFTQVEALKAAGKLVISKELKLPYKKLASFYASDIGKRLLASTNIQREMNFNRLLPGKYFYKGASEADSIFVQGVIDLLFAEADGWVLVDYKTDHITAEEALAKYAVQLELYAEAAKDILQQPIKEAYLYMVSTGELVNCPTKVVWDNLHPIE